MKTRWVQALLIVCTVVLAGLCSTPADAGQYDGIWFSPADYTSIFALRHNDELILGIKLDFDDGEFAVFAGAISGNRANLQSIIDDQDVNAAVTFSTDTAATITIISCEPAGACGSMQAGVTFPITKFF